MPADPKPLFRPEAIQPLLEAFEPSAAALAARPKLQLHWHIAGNR